MKYHAIPARIIVMPAGESIHADEATVVELDDEGAGPFVRVSQHDADHSRGVALAADDWPLIRDAIQEMLNVANGLDAEKLPMPPNTPKSAAAESRPLD